MSRIRDTTEGSLMVTVLILLTILSLVVVSLSMLANSNLVRASSRIYLLQTQYSAESGADIAISRLNNGALTAYDYSALAAQSGSEVEVVRNNNMYRSTYQVKMSDGATADQKIVTAVGRVYTPTSSTTPKYTRTIRVTVKRSSSSATSSVVSRNIIEIGSSVKEVWAKDLFVNGYIQMDKNVNQLIAENITVGGKNTGASNCSIGGSGSLQKPTSFANAGQTKTVLNLAYNNCVTPPGNTSNADFTVNANRSDITPIQSTYIPWSYVMDNTYTSSPTGCSDWTTFRTVPSVGNDKKTHYPDSSSGVSASCGTNGTISLGSSTVTITDNSHVRANLCSPTATCSPTFNNTSGSPKFVFVEGTLSFAAFKTAAGSAPVIFVVYGSDPAALSGVCPLGGAAFLDSTSSDNVDAPAAYIIAVNGSFCANGTKFGASRSLGGVSGKNIYIATSSGTPFDLSFDPSFPVNQIPINLTWKATIYERL